jgi:hypothetical protein
MFESLEEERTLRCNLNNKLLEMLEEVGSLLNFEVKRRCDLRLKYNPLLPSSCKHYTEHKRFQKLRKRERRERRERRVRMIVSVRVRERRRVCEGVRVYVCEVRE